jgi:hypothetical protein
MSEHFIARFVEALHWASRWLGMIANVCVRFIRPRPATTVNLEVTVIMIRSQAKDNKDCNPEDHRKAA